MLLQSLLVTTHSLIGEGVLFGKLLFVAFAELFVSVIAVTNFNGLHLWELFSLLLVSAACIHALLLSCFNHRFWLLVLSGAAGPYNCCFWSVPLLLACLFGYVALSDTTACPLRIKWLF